MLTTIAVIASTFVSNNWLLTQEPVPSSAECLRVAEEMLDQLKQEVGSPDLTTICLDNRPSFTSASELNRLLLAYTPEAEAYQDINISVQITRTITMVMTDGQIIVHQPQNVTSTTIVRDFVQVSFPSKVECDDAISSLPASVMRGLLKERWNILPEETHNFYKTCVEDSGRWKYFIVDLTQK